MRARSVLDTLCNREIGISKARYSVHPASISSRKKIMYTGYYNSDDSDEWVDEPPYSLAFCHSKADGQLIAFGDESGAISVTHTAKFKKFEDDPASPTNLTNALISRWKCHSNAIFDIAWTNDDMNLLTAAGDRKIISWDVETRKQIKLMCGFPGTGTIKSVSCHPFHKDLVVSGCRNGGITFWDIRKSCGDICKPIMRVQSAHDPENGKNRRVSSNRKQGITNKSVTSVLFMKDDPFISSGGASSKSIKLWDLRNFSNPLVISPELGETISRPSHKGITSLSLDNSGTRLVASCTDSRVYLADPRFLDKGSLKCFKGAEISNFYIKAKISPDGSQIISGDAQGQATLWQVENNGSLAYQFPGDDDQVTVVDWCKTDQSVIASVSDIPLISIWEFASVDSPASGQPKLWFKEAGKGWSSDNFSKNQQQKSAVYSKNNDLEKTVDEAQADSTKPDQASMMERYTESSSQGENTETLYPSTDLENIAAKRQKSITDFFRTN